MITELRVGFPLPDHPGPEITLDSIRTVMQVMGDTNPVHVDEEVVRRLGLRGFVNQGPSNLAYITNMLTAWTGDPDSLRQLRVRFHAVVIPGDQVVAGGRVAAIASDGLVECEVWLRLEDGQKMLSGTATVQLATNPADDGRDDAAPR